LDDETFIVEGDTMENWLHCIELDKFIMRTIVETRSGLIAHRRGYESIHLKGVPSPLFPSSSSSNKKYYS
jgi:hypothetical protein